MGTQRKRVSLADVAAAAGVGKATASRALSPNRTLDVGSDTRDRVRAVAASLGYTPNRTAQALRTGKTYAFGLITPLGEGEWWAPVMEGAHEAAAPLGYRLTFHPIRDMDDIDEVLADIRMQGIDGVILMTGYGVGRLAEQAHDLPIVLIDDADDAPGLPTVRAANREGAFELGRHLIATGRRAPLVIAPESGLHYVRERLAGFREALARDGVEVDESRVIVPAALTWNTPDSDELTALLRERVGKFDSVFTIVDWAAPAVLRSLRRLGLAVPQDVAVVGYDDDRIARVVDPTLTTIHQPFHRMGAAAIRMLATLVDGGEPAVPLQELPTTLIVRSSS